MQTYFFFSFCCLSRTQCLTRLTVEKSKSICQREEHKSAMKCSKNFMVKVFTHHKQLSKSLLILKYFETRHSVTSIRLKISALQNPFLSSWISYELSFEFGLCFLCQCECIKQSKSFCHCLSCSISMEICCICHTILIFKDIEITF